MHKPTPSNPSSSFRFFSPSSSLSTPSSTSATPAITTTTTATTATTAIAATTTTVNSTAAPPIPPSAASAVTTPDDSYNHQTSYFLRSNSSKKPNKPPLLTHHKSLDNVMFGRVGGREYVNVSVTTLQPVGQAPQSPNAQYEMVFEIATKRMATLDYLRRAHEGRVYWFNTVLFTRKDLDRGIYHESKKLSKRATHYFVLGTSIPNILDLGTSSPLDYLKAFLQLLTEYETYQSQNHDHGTSHLHSSTSSGGLRLASSSVRINRLFSRSKPRRGSTATTVPSLPSASSMPAMSTLPTSPPESIYPSSQDSLLERSRSLSGSTTNLPSISSQSLSSDSSDPPPVPPLPAHTPPPIQYGMSISNPLPAYSSSSTNAASFGTPGAANGESEYMYLTIPPLPFDPDFFETFATLCDVLIDAYSRVLSLVSTPQQCTVGVGEMFLKADAKVRKCLVGMVVKDFEEASRGPLGVKGEIAGLGKLVLGGMI